MRPMRVLITGGAGFVGANLAIGLACEHPDWDVVALDNLHRRGSELNLRRLARAGVSFRHGDVRELADLMAVERIDALVDCAAEPSVLAADVGYVVGSNLTGAHNCLELARRDNAQVVFLSTSRVYPHAALDRARYREAETRFELTDEQDLPGISAYGVSERFPLDGARTLYGATKLAAELLVAEYANSFGLATVVDRCGVIAGPWQMGKVDQGVFTYWAIGHYFNRPLRYIGYGGSGKQVRDVLHIDDLIELLESQLLDPEGWRGLTVNVGGGRDHSLSLAEATDICRELTGHRVEIARSDEQRPGDVRIYVSDCTALGSVSDWRPSRGVHRVLAETVDWIGANETALKRALA
jgi:CDP-paratose 2-epimerase